jgi:hypothetical protein
MGYRKNLYHQLGTDVVIFKNFSKKNLAKKSAFLTQIKGNFSEKVIITLVFEKNIKIFAQNWPKSQNIVIITSVLHMQVQRIRYLIPAFSGYFGKTFAILFSSRKIFIQLPPFDTTSRNGYTANGSAVRAEIVWLPFG